MTRAITALVALGLAFGSACESAEIGRDDIACVHNAECPASLTCSFNHCIASGTNALTVQMRVTPPVSSGLLVQNAPNVRVADGPDLVVKLLQPASVRGVVRIDRDALTVNVPGDLEVRAPGDIVGLDYRFVGKSLQGVDADGFGFELVVLPGRRYQGVFRPSDPSLARANFTIEATDIAAGRFDLVLPALTLQRKIEGRVRETDYSPITNARVVVLNLNGEVIGTTTSDAERGLFEVAAAPDITEVLVKVEPATDGKLAPEFLAGPFPVGTSIDIEMPELVLGNDAFQTTLRVVGLAPSNALGEHVETPMRGLTVTMSSVFALGTLRRTGTTDAHGELAVAALPGAYECLVTVPSNQPFASWHGLIWLAPADLPGPPERHDIVLLPRIQLSGHITDVLGQPVTEGTVTAFRRGDRAATDTLALVPPPFEAEIDADGRYHLALDPGVYDVWIAPALATDAPNTIVRGIEVPRIENPSEAAPMTRDVVLPPPGLLHLTVSEPDGRWLPDAAIELWIADGDERLVLARAMTGPTGFVDVLVPFEGAEESGVSP